VKYSGIDLHSNNSVVVVSDEADRVLVRRRLANDPATILALLAGHREELVGVVVESTYNWYWLVDALQAAGYRVHLANTAAIKRYEGLKYSGDEDDAAYLAQLLRLGILPSGYICPPATRAVRDLARKRMQLVRSRTAQVLAVENMLSRETGAGMRSYAVQRLTVHAVAGFGFTPGCGTGAVRQCGGDQDAQPGDQQTRAATAPVREIAARIPLAYQRAGDWADASDADHAGGGHDRALCRGG
jgi:transposase